MLGALLASPVMRIGLAFRREVSPTTLALTSFHDLSDESNKAHRDPTSKHDWKK